MTSKSINSAQKPDRSVGILIQLLIWTRWILIVLLVAIPLTLFSGGAFPLRIGPDRGDPSAEGPTAYIGAVFDADLSQAAVFAEALTMVIFVGLGLYIITQMLGVLRNVRNGDAFARDNGVRLRRIGFAGMWCQLSAYGVWAAAKALEALGVASFEGLSLVISPAPWIGVLSAFALATVFGKGTELKEEQDLTV